MKIVSIQVGMPRVVGRPDAEDLMDREWTSGIFKDAVTGPVQVMPTGLAGDGQADLRHHGGPDKAINAYPEEHYEVWRRELGVSFAAGAFGENFTTSGALETEVCVGDVLRIGTVVMQVTQPRQPCWKLARRWRLKDLAARVEQTGRTGWYYRVIETGIISAPASTELLERPYPQWTIAFANEIMHRRKTDWVAARELSACPALSESWKAGLGKRAESRTVAPTAPRLEGH